MLFAYSPRGRSDRQGAEAQVVAEANGALQWLEEKQKLQSSLRPTDDPVLLSSDIAKKETTLQRFAEPILNKPAPPPPPKVCCQLLALRKPCCATPVSVLAFPQTWRRLPAQVAYMYEMVETCMRPYLGVALLRKIAPARTIQWNVVGRRMQTSDNILGDDSMVAANSAAGPDVSDLTSLAWVQSQGSEPCHAG